MTTFVRRYEIDPSRPEGGVVRDLAVRALAPAAAWWCVLVGLGFLIVGPLDDLPAGDHVEGWFADRRTPALDTVTEWVGHLGATGVVICVTVLTVTVLWWRTRQWWFALVPALAVSLQSTLFVAASALVGRERPGVPQLDEAPPTSSFPSGHTGASTALWLTLMMLAQCIRHPVLRVAATVLCVLVPLLVGTSRIYRGMHCPADVALGLANGTVCMVLAWGYLRRSVPGRS
ncbi:phosphatase PAP2 family protein [Isoptericola croceus]|uniref:phosphatase PAP2 family protein n=1 Tax=Isoptericola croceus TaxID=3031406 RepID=UPI0023F8C2D0|nr:phosphatase PAP2 family protein [Isoptericola croceus]